MQCIQNKYRTYRKSTNSMHFNEFHDNLENQKSTQTQKSYEFKENIKNQ